MGVETSTQFRHTGNEGYLGAFSDVPQLVYFDEDASDSSSQIFHSEAHLQLLSDDQIREIREMQEEDSKHGSTHLGRVDAWYRQFVFQSNLQEIPFFSDYIDATADAIQLHDIVEVVAQDKINHAEYSAMYSIAADTLIQKNFDMHKAQMGRMDLSMEQWIKYKWAKAFMIRYHHPEDIPSTEHILQHGLFNVFELNDFVGDFSGKFPPFKNVQSAIPLLLNEEPPTFSREEVEAIRMQAYLLAAADKMDQLTPIRLSSNRTIKLNPERALYTDENYKRGWKPSEEFKLRREQGSMSECDDDLSRFLFEMCRTDAFADAPEIVQVIYGRALREKTYFLRDAVREFMNRNFEPFVSIYDEMHDVTKDNILYGLGFKQKGRESILWDSHGHKRYDSDRRIKYFLEMYGFDSALLDKTISEIDDDRDIVYGLLEIKYEKMRKAGLLTKWHRQRINELLDIAVDTMEKKLGVDSQGNIDLPYNASAYFPIKWSHFKRTA